MKRPEETEVERIQWLYAENAAAQLEYMLIAGIIVLLFLAGFLLGRVTA